MKLLRVGPYGQEKVAALDSANNIRDLSTHIEDLNPATLNESNFKKLSQIDLSKLKEVNAKNVEILGLNQEFQNLCSVF